MVVERSTKLHTCVCRPEWPRETEQSRRSLRGERRASSGLAAPGAAVGAAVASPMSRLVTLPVEILVSIFRHVEFRDLKQLRLACKFFGPLAEPILFHTVVVVPHLDSLEALVSLSEHASIRKCVQILFYDNRWGDFSRWLWEAPGQHVLFDDCGTPTAPAPVPQASPLLNQLAAGALADDGMDVEIGYLSRAFSKLPSLSGFGCLEPSVSGTHNSEPVPAFYSRFVELGQFEGPRWDCLGYEDPPQGSWGVFSLFSAMFAARVSVPDLRVDDVAWDDMFQSAHRLQMFRAVLSPIRRLKISTQVDPAMVSPGSAGPRVGSIMGCFSALEDLDLAFRPAKADSLFSGADWEGHGLDVLAISRPPFPELLPGETYFPRLGRLTLAGFCVQESDLLSFLGRHAKTLSILRLASGHLTPAAETGDEACWVRVIRQLQAHLHLKKMRFSRYLGNYDSQSWELAPFGPYTRPGCLKERVEKFVVHGGACPLEKAAVGLPEDEAGESRTRFEGDDSWWITRGHPRLAPHA